MRAQLVKEESPGGTDQMIDIISAIEELSVFSSQELNTLLKDSENFSIQCKTEKGSLQTVNLERLASSLPLHLIATLLSPDRDMCMGHVLRGVRLLHTLSDLAARHARLEQVLLDDIKLSEQIMDLVLFILIVLSRRKQDNRLGASPVLHSALVACSLHLLASCLSSQWHDLVHVLLAHPKVDIFMDAAFDAVHEDIRILGIKLQELDSELLGNILNLPAAERTANYTCQQCEASLQFLLSLCQQKLFRDRVLRNKELCKHGGILSLAYSILKLHVPQSLEKSADVVAAVSRLKAKILSILLQLCEAESISYLDEVAGSQKSMHLAKSVALAFLDLLRIAFRSEAKQPGDTQYRSNPIGLLLLNTLRLADIFSDDSNFRSFFMTTSIPVLAEILAVPHEDFSLTWCSLNIPVIEEEVNLEYDPFIAAGLALVSLSDGSESSDSAPCFLTETNYGNSSSTTRERDGSVQEDGSKLDMDLKGKITENSAADQSEDFEVNYDKKKNTNQSEPLRDGEKEDFDSKSEYTKESGLPEDEKAENGQSEERQPRKRKRNIMNETQIFLIEKALLDEPEMQRNAAALQSWADKLSSQGSEITSSQLKNWLNNRKARLARAAREARAPSEGDTSYPDKSSAPSSSHICDSPDSAGEEIYTVPVRGSTHQSYSRSGGMITRSAICEDVDMITPTDFVDRSQQNRHSLRCTFEPGQLVSIVDMEGKLVGKGKITQVEGRWHGNSLGDSCCCIVDVTELKIDKSKEVQHPSEAAGRTFEEAAAKNGHVMRVAWDTARIVPFP
ncbi:hypothetical protein Cni_G12054 [Canna indica]|uniref:Homeobox domain-containing protein n=1 Tax=Canna indica TaxID=4628 RepID=A0AAQ3K8Q8_9LILI|nr:hypothetical protein Cni_G12054 [Canna indica]